MIKILKAKNIKHRNGSIAVFERYKTFKIKIERIFIVKANKNQIRGMHAHKKCIQLLNCPIGAVSVSCEYVSGNKKIFILNSPEKYLVIPRYVWCSQKYLKKNTILVSICNRKFEEKDYIRNYKKFKTLRI